MKKLQSGKLNIGMVMHVSIAIVFLLAAAMLTATGIFIASMLDRISNPQQNGAETQLKKTGIDEALLARLLQSQDDKKSSPDRTLPAAIANPFASAPPAAPAPPPAPSPAPAP